MSRISYEFATASSTGWCHSISCDMHGCDAKVVRDGALPTNENSQNFPRFSPYARDGWGSFVWSVGEVDCARDFCPQCARQFNDLLLEHGVNIGTHETKYLDALGREIEKPQEARGTRFCWAIFGPRDSMRCFLLEGHEGEHSVARPEGQIACAACAVASVYLSPPLAFTAQGLESHAVEVHRVRRNERGQWYTELELPEVTYADCATALRGEAKLTNQRENERQQRTFEDELRARFPGSGAG